MSVNRGYSSVIHTVDQANLTAYTYNQIYAGVDSTVKINGTNVFLVASTVLNLTITTLSAATGTTQVYVLGDNINITHDNPNIYPLGS